MEIEKAKITIIEILERMHKAKRSQDFKNMLQVHQTFQTMEEKITDLNKLLGDEELKNSILGAKIQQLNRKITNLEKEI